MTEIGTHAHPEQRRGRGALSNASGRYEAEERVQVDDGWTQEERPPPLRTQVSIDTSRTIIARNTSPDLNFDRSINPYRGCEHGCVYCFARPTHAWLGLSPGLDFESRLFAKPDAAALLEKALCNPRYACRTLAMGTNTDPYQPLERKLAITRAILTVLDRFRHPVGIVTKSALVTRDVDLLAGMAERRLAKVFLSVTTLDRDLARAMEPRAATPERRLEAIAELAGAGIPVGVMVAPTIPGLTDHEMERILEAARKAGAGEAGYIALRLPLEIKDLWAEWLAANRPNHARRVMTLLRQMRGGRDYDARFGTRMTGTGPYADLLEKRFRAACNRLGYRKQTLRLDNTAFAVPAGMVAGTAQGQLDLFGQEGA